MTLTLVVADDGNTGVDLRRHRGAHDLLGAGQCRRLAKLLPALVKDNGTAAVVPHRVALWLGSALVGLKDDAKAELFFARLSCNATSGHLTVRDSSADGKSGH